MAKHSCDMCKPYQRELRRLQVAGLFRRRDARDDIEVATYKLGIVRELVCSESPPELDEAYLPAGKHRQRFLDNRITSKCPPCQRLADEYVIVSESARSFKAALQQQMLRADGNPADFDDSLGQHAALQTHYAKALEELLRECERINCPNP